MNTINYNIQSRNKNKKNVEVEIKNYELGLISNISSVLFESADDKISMNELFKYFNKYGRLSQNFVEMKSLNLLVFDRETKKLKNYGSPSMSLSNEYEEIYKAAERMDSFDIFVNNKNYKRDEIKDFSIIPTNLSTNIIWFPVKTKNIPVGLLQLVFPNDIKNFLNNKFLDLMTIICNQIALKIQNDEFTVQLEKSIEFNKIMRGISKIIETQYELNYVIPVIGEMIDKFLKSHMIYVFLRKEQKKSLKLAWPKLKNDENIADIASKMKSVSKPAVVDSGKMAIFPLIGKENAILGCFVAYSKTVTLSREDLDYLNQLSKQASITLQKATSYIEVLNQATLDALTGLNNRHQFESRLRQEVNMAKRLKTPLSAIMLDIDFFKKVNDTHGHNAGDCALTAVSGVIKSKLREYDIASRYGGEEFVILLPSTKLHEAQIVAERLRAAVESTVITPDPVNQPDFSFKVTISVGVNELKDSDSPQDLHTNADKALYAAKEGGRNRVVLYSEALADVKE